MFPGNAELGTGFLKQKWLVLSSDALMNTWLWVPGKTLAER